MKLRIAFLSFSAAAMLMACSRPHPANGTLLCGSGGTCPEGYRCHPKPGTNDNACYEIGSELMQDMSSPPDLADADADRPSASTMCEQLCACLMTTCNGVGAPAGADDDQVACGNACLANTTQDLYCRWYHCTVYATKATVPHCFHARGAGDPIVCQ